ncbi:MAG: metallophosphoesterase [Candidatus Parcubacteria bacterium]|nr:metallophosphoesterase [Candidatus Parcubacteria bacterium]
MPLPKTLTIIRFGFFLLIALGSAVLAHFIIYTATVAAWPISWPVPRAAIQIVLGILGAASVAILLIVSRYNTKVTRTAYRIIAVWMGLFVYFFFASFFYGIIVGLGNLAGVHDTFAWSGRLLGIAAILAGIYGLIHAHSIKEKRIKLALPSLPAFWKGKRAVFISDIHLGQIRGAEFSRRIADRVNAAQPEIVFIGGDLYDGVKIDEHVVVAPLASMKPPHGVYFVTGNHEEFSDSSNFLKAIRGLGIRVLLNELVDVNGLQIVGVTDHDSVEREKLTQILAALPIDRSRASIFLKHQPSYLDIPEQAGLSIQISGHTHRAQQFPLNVLPYLIYKGYSYGLKRFKNMQVYTSSGVGSWGPPMRVGSDSEIVVIEFV